MNNLVSLLLKRVSCVFKMRIVMLTFYVERIIAFEIVIVSVNGKSQVMRKRDIFCTTVMFSAIIKVLVLAEIVCIFRVPERTAEFLEDVSPVREFIIFPHNELGITDEIFLWKAKPHKYLLS